MKSKQELLSQKIITVCNPDFPTPAMIEFIGKLGFDGVFLDCEHSSSDFQLIADCSRAARLVNLHSLLRPWSNDPGLINRYLSCGVGGVQAPHVHSAADARNIIEGLKRWGDGNYEEKLLVVMVESQQAVDNLPEILKIKDIDVLYIGANDLAESMGLKGKRKDPKVQATVEDIIKRVSDAGKIAGMNVQEDLEAVTHFMRLGMRYVNVHMKQFMDRGSRAFLAGLK